MKDFFNTIRRDRFLFGGYIISCTCMLLTALYIAIFYQHLPPLIPLYNQLRGQEEHLAPTSQLFFVFSIVVFTFIGNFLFSSLLYKRIPLVARMLSITCFLTAFLVLLFIVRTIELIR